MKGFSKSNNNKLKAKEMRLLENTQNFYDEDEDSNVGHYIETATDFEYSASPSTSNLQDDLTEWYKDYHPPRKCVAGLLQILNSRNPDDALALESVLDSDETSANQKLAEIEENQKMIMETLKSVQAQIEIMHDHHTKQTAKLQAAINQVVQKSLPAKCEYMFPIESEEGLHKIEEEISQNYEVYVDLIRAIVLPDGLAKNFKRLLATNMILELNYNGVQGKKAFSEYVNLNKALYDAIRDEGYTHSDFVREMRAAFKAFKERHYKYVYSSKKRAKEVADIDVKPPKKPRNGKSLFASC